MSDKVEPKVGEVWENIFDYSRTKILSVKYSDIWNCTCVKYVKDDHTRELIKPIKLFLGTYTKIL